MTYTNTCYLCAKQFDGVAKMSECYECFIVRVGETKMGAMKNLLMDVNEQVYKISLDLNQASESGDLDLMKQALRQAIVNSALSIAFIDELENNL